MKLGGFPVSENAPNICIFPSPRTNTCSFGMYSFTKCSLPCEFMYPNNLLVHFTPLKKYLVEKYSIVSLRQCIYLPTLTLQARVLPLRMENFDLTSTHVYKPKSHA